MFSLKIVDTDAFLEMPLSSQVLYFHLSMRADDDGFVGNPRKIMRMIGAQEDDFRVLVTKRFILPFESGVCVIKHWRMHNLIRGDRYSETSYIEEKSTLLLKENGSYTERTENVIPNGNHLATQVRLGKVRLGKDRREKNAHGEFQNVFLTDDEHTKLIEALGEKNTALLIAELSSYIESTGKNYKSHYPTLQNWARRRVQEQSRSLRAKGKGLIV